MSHGKRSEGGTKGRAAGIVIGALILVGGASPARAVVSEASQRVAIGIRGPQAARLQDAVETALLRRYHLVPDNIVTEAARKSGVRLLTSKDFAEVARSLNVQAFVSVTVKKQRNWSAQMIVRKGDTGQAVGRYDWTDRRIESLALALARFTPRRLAALLSNDTSPPPLAPDEELRVKAPSLPDQAGEEGAGEEPSGHRPRPYLELAVGGRVFSRTMSFVDNYSGVPGYQLARATAVTVDLVVQPFAFSSRTLGSWVSGLGLTGGFSYAIDVATQRAGSEARSPGEVYSYDVGLRQRITFGRFDLLPHAGYLVDTFVANAGEQSPDVRYRVVRAGLGGELALSARTTVRASVDYLHVLGAGPLAEAGKFPRATARGIDLGAGATFAFNDTLEAQLQVGLRRYGFDMKAEPGDTLLVGGAVDQYLSMTVGLAFRPALGRSR
jgi:hypothetical protein